LGGRPSWRLLGRLAEGLLLPGLLLLGLPLLGLGIGKLLLSRLAVRVGLSGPAIGLLLPARPVSIGLLAGLGEGLLCSGLTMGLLLCGWFIGGRLLLSGLVIGVGLLSSRLAIAIGGLVSRIHGITLLCRQCRYDAA